MKRILIVDGLNLFLYNFTANPLMDTNGEHIGGSIGFLISLKNTIKMFEPDLVIVAWDGEGGSLKRRSIYKDYKVGRKPKLNREYDFENPDKQIASMANQLRRLDKYLEYLPLISIRLDGVEADDIIAYIANFFFDDDEKIIASTDRDFFQLISDKISVYSPRMKKVFYSNDVKESLGVIPENVIFFKSVVGDNSDNVKGLKGVGKETFIKMFPFTSERETTLAEMKQYATEHLEKHKQYSKFLEGLDKIEENIKIMQLSNPMMDSKTAAGIRSRLSDISVKYKQSDLNLKFHMDNVQLKAADFFTVFGVQHIRTTKKNEQ